MYRVRSILRLVCGLSLVALGTWSPAFAAAQGPTVGALRGQVLDESGLPLSGVRIVLSPAGGGGERSTVSGRNGMFEFLMVPPGTWTARAERLGYRPLVALSISVRPAGEAFVPMILVAAPPPVESVDTVTWEGGGGGLTAGGWYPEAVLERQPLPGTGLLGVLALGPGDGDRIAGLPGRFTGVELNGLRVSRAVHPAFGADPVPDLAWPRAALAAADYDATLTAPERMGDPGGVLTGFLRRGPPRFAISAVGAWQPSGLASSRFFAPDVAERTSWHGAVTLGGPVVRDTAEFSVTVAMEDVALPQPAPWNGAVGPDTVRGAARDAWGVDLARWSTPWVTRQRTSRVAGRFDWLVAGRHLVSLTGAWGRLEIDDPDYGGDRLGWLGSRLDGTDWHGGVTVLSRLGTGASELRLGISRTAREAQSPAGGRTVLVGEALGVGASAGFGGAHAVRTFTLSETVHVPSGAHRIALGAGMSADATEASWAWGTGGERYYADATRFAAGEGALVSVIGSVPTVRHTQVGIGMWFEDTWRAAPGLDLVGGARLDVLRRPAGAVTTNTAWQNLTGLDNAAYGGTVLRVSPRGALRWTPSVRSAWNIEIAGGWRASTDERDAFSELVSHDGRVTVRRAVGALGTWPSGSGTGPARPRLALLAPDFVPPRAGRVGMTIIGDLGAIALRLAGSYRHTDFLPRRTNLNRLPAAAGTDQHGRPLYGTLIQQGALLAADPSGGRRFSGFDLVSALNADGAQDRWEASFALERRFGGTLGLLVAYTVSDTRDNWLGALGGGPDDQLDPFPDGLAGQSWSEGRSDLDVPHRVIAALDLRVLSGLRLGGLLRIQSGTPFTPGFRPGVDANADGSARNDPAFVDGSLPGMDALMSAWPCLAAQVGRFAARNACRAPATRALDLWLRFDLSAIRGLPLALTVEARNIVEPDIAARDAAVHLVDGSGAVATDPVSGQVTVPLVVNPNFGAPLTRRGTARAVWIGIRVND